MGTEHGSRLGPMMWRDLHEEEQDEGDAQPEEYDHEKEEKEVIGRKVIGRMMIRRRMMRRMMRE